MTPKPKPKKAAVSAKSQHDGDRKIVRDETFVRAVADEIMPLALGRDIELCCLQFSPILKTMLDKGDHYIPVTENVFAEVARVRISYAESVDLAMRILAQGITSGKVKGKTVVASIEQWIAEFDAHATMLADDDAH